MTLGAAGSHLKNSRESSAKIKLKLGCRVRKIGSG